LGLGASIRAVRKRPGKEKGEKKGKYPIPFLFGVGQHPNLKCGRPVYSVSPGDSSGVGKFYPQQRDILSSVTSEYKRKLQG
jgi:hypothetical protein